MKLKNADDKTEVSDLYKYQIEKIVNLVIDWCVVNLGHRKWCPNIIVDVVKENAENGAGWYVPFRHGSEITINFNGNENIMDLIDTVIHEYAHYLQPNFKEIYAHMSTEYEYHNNPIEVEARETARHYRNKCFTEIKKFFRYERS